MLSDNENAANEAVQEALKAIQRARELCERAEYGMLVLEPLSDAQRSTQYALDTVLGRNLGKDLWICAMTHKITGRSSFDDLPPDQYGVRVVNEVDAIRLKWLVEAIGETKLRRSVEKYNLRYPDCQPYVSLLLQWYHLAVPPAFYASVPVPIYWVYMLRMSCGNKFKVGMTGRWPFRVWDFVRKSNEPAIDRGRLEQTFDMQASQAWLVGGNKIEARRREDVLKKALASWRVQSPWYDGQINYGAGGHNEWFDASQFQAAVDLATSFDRDRPSVCQTLGKAVEIARHSELERDPDVPH